MVGAMAVITLVSLALGARNVFLQQFESFGLLNQVQVYAITDLQEIERDDDPFGGFGGGDNGGELAEGARKLDKNLVKELEDIPHVESVNPSVRPFMFEGISLAGSDDRFRPDVVSKTVALQEYVDISHGRGFANDDERDVAIVPFAYAQQFGFGENPQDFVGEEIELTTWNGFFGPDSELPDWRGDGGRDAYDKPSVVTAEVIGVIGETDGPGGPDGESVLLTLGWTEYLMQRKEWDWDSPSARNGGAPGVKLFSELENGYHSIVIEADDTQNVEAIAEEVKTKNVNAITSKEILDGILQVFDIIEIVLGAIGAISLLVASIGIANTMVMAIYERTKEIGLMKAVGATRSSIWKLFTVEAGLLGFWGGVAGVGVGYALSLVANQIANRMLAEDGISAQDIVELPWWLVLGMLAFTTVVGTLAGLYPAARAARLDPIDALWRE